jgi:hypothetical protein
MRYTVTSSDEVDNKLARIYLLARDRDAVSRASNRIDWVLKYSPLSEGTDLGAFRVLTLAPLTVVYSVSPDDRLVTILDYFHSE